MNYWIIFLTGLTTGGISCLAVQGGLLTSIIANQKKKEVLDQPTELSRATSFDKKDWGPALLFLGTKLISHTILGFLLGTAGSLFAISLGTKLFFQGITALFMFATAMNLLRAHPIFRFVQLQPPAFIRRAIFRSKNGDTWFAPAVLGLFTIFIPCGVTQAMEIVAMNSGSGIQGALTMFAFVLGTSPIFAFLGIATAKFSETLHQAFLSFAAILLIWMSLSSINGIVTVLDLPFSFTNIREAASSIGAPPSWYGGNNASGATTQIENGKQSITIAIHSSGYSPTYFRVKKGIPVELTLQTQDAYSCATSFVFRAMNIKAQLGPNDVQTFSFTPTQTGKFTYSCSMGMYTGTMEVVE